MRRRRATFVRESMEGLVDSKIVAMIIGFPLLFLSILFFSFEYGLERPREQMWALLAKEETWAARDTEKWTMTATSIMDNLEDEQLRRFNTITAFITSCLTGFGTEFLLGVHVVTHVPDYHLKFLWFTAQFLFPFMIFVSVQQAGARNSLCYPFLVFGMWKFGFPETALYLSKVLEWPQDRIGFLGWFSNALAGLGVVMHHTCSALILSSIQNGIVPMTPHVVKCILPLVIQHWFALIRYYSYGLYAVLSLSVEAVFEWEILSHLQNFLYGAPWFTWLSATGVLFAHWLYLLSSLFEVLHQQFSPGELSDEPVGHDLGTMSSVAEASHESQLSQV